MEKIMKDWNGREIEIGDFVRHVYEPWPLNEDAPLGRGYHRHMFAGTAIVNARFGQCVEVRSVRRGINVYLGCLLEVVDQTTLEKHIVPISGPYREPAKP